MTHLTPDELLDAMEGLLAAERQSHLDACEQCRRELAGLSAALSDARHVEVPEPSPLFWQHFSERVRTAIDAEPVPAAGLAAWLRWPVLAPLGALALVVLALVFVMPGRREQPQVAVAGSDAGLSEASWVAVANLVGSVDFDTASAAGVAPRPAAVEQALLELTPGERQELTRLLEAELKRVKS